MNKSCTDSPPPEKSQHFANLGPAKESGLFQMGGELESHVFSE